MAGILENDTTRAFLAPILAYLDDDSVTEILINSAEDIWIERSGRLEKAETSFDSDDSLWAAVRNIAQFVGRRIDEDNPILDARLPDGSRIHVVIPPCAKDGLYLAIRKFGSKPLEMKDLMTKGALSVEMARFLHGAVQLKKNLLVSGSTSSGKTTVLNCISSFIPETQRIIVIEDASELQLQQPHAIRLEAYLGDEIKIEIRDLVKSALRLRPDRIVIGEVRGPEALDLLQAMTTGHSGSMSTLHANNPKQALARLETLIMMNRLDLPLMAIRSQIANAIHLVVQASRLADGTRRLTHISELTGLDADGNYLINDLFLLEVLGVHEDGRLQVQFRSTGNRPSFFDEAQKNGIKLPEALFEPKENSHPPVAARKRDQK